MQLQTTPPESKFSNEYIDVIFIQIDQRLKELLKKYKGVPILWNTVQNMSYEENKNSSGDEIANVQNNGRYAVQGHSRSPILVPIESPYATSY